METLGQWVRDYSHGTLISFDFTATRRWSAGACHRAENGWDYDEIPGDLGLPQRWVDGEWNEEEFLVVQGSRWWQLMTSASWAPAGCSASLPNPGRRTG